jgi:ribulose-phosphate 3-epimerase
VHQETVPHLNRTVNLIKEHGAAAGVALNPATPLAMHDDILPDLDYVLLMSVNPGFGGQRFIPSVVPKVKALAARLRDRGLETRIEVDGGIGAATLPRLLEAGATLFVAGSAVFDGGQARARAAELTALIGRGPAR